MLRAFRNAAVTAAFFVFSPFSAVAQDIVLTSRDGSLTVEGVLLGYDGEFYRLDTEYGILTVDGQGVICQGPGCPDLTSYVARVRFSGDRALGEILLPALVESYAISRDLRTERVVEDDAHFTYRLSTRVEGRLVAEFSFRVSTSEEGFADLVAEEADLAMTVREPLETEIERGLEAGIGDLAAPRRARIVALDGLVPVVSFRNPLKAISFAKLQASLAGELKTWSEIDARLPDDPVLLHAIASKTDAEPVTAYRVLEISKPRTLTTDHGSYAELSDAVASDGLALGATGYSEVGNARPLRLAGPCGLFITSSRSTLKTEDYPLTTPLFLYTPARRLPLFAREFLAWLTTPAAQSVVQRSGFVNQSPEVIPMARQGDRLANAILGVGEDVSFEDIKVMVETLQGAARLSTTFRFREGSSRMDPQSEGNVDLLARALEAGLYDGRTLIFAGFSDGQGPASGNRRISLTRANSAWEAVKKEARTADWSRINVKIEGFGEALPMGCDDVAWGRQINRRVEVWLR